MSDRYDDGRGLSMLIAGFGLGTLVGSIIGLLLAPKAGRELRADISEYGRDTFDKVKDSSREAYERSRERARQAYEAGREKASEYSTRVGQKVGEVAHRVGEAVKTGVEQAREKVAGQHGEQAPPPPAENA